MSILDRIRGKKNQPKVDRPRAEGAVKEDKLEIVEREKKTEKVSEKRKEEKKPRKKASAKKTKVVQKGDNLAYRNILSPLITEKSTNLGQYNKHLFKVHLQANKHQIKDAIERYYGVSVTKVNIIKIRPKVRLQGKTAGFKKGYKKAIITLKAGDTIGAVEGV